MSVQLLPTGKEKVKTAGKTYPGMSVTETVTNGFFTVDNKWTVTSWNKAAEKLLKVAAKKIIGKNLWEEFAATIPLNFYTVYQKAFLHDIPIHFTEYWAEMGAWFDVVTYYSDDTLSVSFKSVNQVHSAHPQVQLKILNELYRFVTEVTNDCLWEWNIKSKELFWIDGSHKRIFGYDIENALIPQSFWEACMHPDDRERVLERLKTIFETASDATWEDEYRFKKADGNYAYVHDRGHIMYEGDKNARMIGATQDITARKLTEIKLFESERKLSLIATQTVNAVIITDAEEKITWVNEAFTTITGYKPAEVIGRTPGSFLQGTETDLKTVDYIRQKTMARQPFDCEIINYTKSGHKYWMHIQGQAVLDKSGHFEQFFAIETDVTEKIMLQHKLIEATITKQKEIMDAVLTAQEYERSEIGKELHDNVNQILGATKLYIEMAKAGDDKREIYLNQASGHLLNVIEEIRKISKILIPQSMGLIGVGESIKILIADLSKVQPIKIKFKEEGIEINDPDEKIQLNIFRIVQEQINNVIKHSAATQAIIRLKAGKNKIELTISDNGKGCDTAAKKEGVGVRNIQSRVELLGGKMVIVSKPGKGYGLKVEFPLKTKISSQK